MTRKNVLSADNQQGRVQQRLQPWYVCGLVDGEGSFHVALYKDAQMKVGTKAIPEFHVSQRVSSRRVFDELVRFFQCGYVKENHRTNPNDVTIRVCGKGSNGSAYEDHPVLREVSTSDRETE